MENSYKMGTRVRLGRNALQQIVHKTKDDYAIEVSELATGQSNITYPLIGEAPSPENT